jgi:hypothetical protein
MQFRFCKELAELESAKEFPSQEDRAYQANFTAAADEKLLPRCPHSSAPIRLKNQELMEAQTGRKPEKGELHQITGHHQQQS